MKLTRLSLTILALLLSNFTFANDDENSDKQALKDLVETFRLAIINKDKNTFKSLFYSDTIPWVAVFTDEMVQAKRKTNANFPRSVNFGRMGSPVDMISDDEVQEEKMWNIQVNSDGYLGSVHFNYSDHRNGVKRAYGTEAWDLVKEDTGWKIVSVKYTVTEVVE